MPRNHTFSEQQILEGFRQGEAFFFQQYFYAYCRMAYSIYDKRYKLKNKANLDFMSLAHQYALYLIEHDWKPLEDHSPQMTLCTWMVNGFRYIVLDALKWYHKEYGSITFDEYVRTFDLSGDLRLQFNRIISDMCDKCLEEKEAELVRLLLIEGYATKEVAEMKGVTPSAISQQYHNIRERKIAPYLLQHFDMELDMPEIMMAEEDIHVEKELRSCSCDISRDYLPKGYISNMDYTMEEKVFNAEKARKAKRTTPDYITELAPNEVFVFGSNLRGMHGGGAALIA